MFKVILCDDNEIILEGLSRQIDWPELGMALCGTASDGEEGLRLIREVRPDLLITDIRMPYIDGLELTRLAKEVNPSLVPVVISGYDDFEYARTAMHLGVRDYVLKPIDMGEMMKTLKAARETCQKLYQNQQAARTGLLRKFLEPPLDLEALEAQCIPFRLDPQACCCIMEVGIQNLNLDYLSEDAQYSVELKFSQLLQQFEGSSLFILEKTSVWCRLFLYGGTKKDVAALRKQAVGQVRRQFPLDAKASGYDVAIASGNVQRGLGQAPLSLSQCIHALKYRFIKGANATIFYEEVESYSKAYEQRGIRGNPLDIDFLTPLKAQDKKGLERQLEALKVSLQQQGGESFLYMTLKVGSLYTRLAKDLGEAGIDIGELFEDPIEEFKKVTASGTLDAVIDNLGKSLFAICDFIKVNKSKYGKVIDEAVRYIQGHYHEPGFCIEEVAGAVSLSASYFSTVFRSETGCTFTDYLIRIRMNQAKELMAHTNLKIYEISSKVGYDNAAYFSAAFKRYTGVSPSEYQASCGTGA